MASQTGIPSLSVGRYMRTELSDFGCAWALATVFCSRALGKRWRGERQDGGDGNAQLHGKDSLDETKRTTLYERAVRLFKIPEQFQTDLHALNC